MNRKDYRKILDELIRKSFPKLKKKCIWITSSPIQISWPNATFVYFGLAVWIIVFPKTKNYSNAHLRGLFAHELSHYEILLNMSFIEKIKFAFKWLFTKKGKAECETAVDKYAIKKGYARGYYDLVMRNEKIKTREQLEKRAERGYLSSKAIKTYAKKVGKG